MSLQIGDYVRLSRGWTRMVLIGETSNGYLLAQYDNNPMWSPVVQDSFEQPDIYKDQKRHRSDPYGFVPWDGAPNLNQKWTLTMDYQVINNPNQTGTQVGRTKDGMTILEFDDGSIDYFAADEIERVYPYTIHVKGVNSRSYDCHYIVPRNAVKVGEMILSDSGNLYTVVKLDTKKPSAKVFKGKRVVTQEL